MKLRKLSVAFLLFAVMIVFLSFTILTSASVSSPSSNDGILFEAYGSELIREPAIEFPTRVVAANLQQGGRELSLTKVTIIDPQGKRIQEKPVDKKVENIVDKIDTVDSLKKLLGFNGPQGQQEQRRKYQSFMRQIVANLHKSEFRVDLKKIKRNLQPGDSFTFKVIGTFSSAGEEIQRVGTLSVLYEAALPTISGWYPGDGHIHTAFSDADFYSVDERAHDAADPYGLKWIIITDHPQMMDLVEPNGNENGDYGADEWALENSEVAGAQTRYSIAVMNGEEVSTRINPYTGHDSHYLSYDLDNFFINYYNENNNPLNWLTENRDGQWIIDDVESAGGFGIIAHPSWAPYPWDYWDTTGYKGLELTSGVVNAPLDMSPKPVDATTENTWVSLLNEGKRVVGVANSDAHLADAYGKITTYLYIPNWNGLNHGAVYEALENGRAVASERGSLAVFTATTPSYSSPVNIGDTMYLNPSDEEPITLSVRGLGANSRPLSKIRLYSNYAAPASFSASKTSIKISKTGKTDYPYPSSTTNEFYFRIEADFKVSSRSVETVYTNPIWVRPKVVLTFEDLLEGQYLGTHYPGLTFSSAWKCADHATGKYNTSSYPPRSGTKAVWTGLSETFGTIWFSSPVRFLEGWFSTGYGVTMEAYDSNGNLVASGSLGQVSGYKARIRLTVPPSVGPISYVVVHDSANYWDMDDFAYGR